MKNIQFDISTSQEIIPGIYSTGIDGLWFIHSKPHFDDRGFYTELARIPELDTVRGVQFTIKQVNHAFSKPKVTRGFHSEGWNKLVTISRGVAFCALADVRPGSPSFGQVVTFNLGNSSDALAGSLFVSAGIANSVCAYKDSIDYLYFVDKLYYERDPADDQAISLFDPDLGVKWPISQTEMILSNRDMTAVTMREKFPSAFIA